MFSQTMGSQATMGAFCRRRSLDEALIANTRPLRLPLGVLLIGSNMIFPRIPFGKLLFFLVALLAQKAPVLNDLLRRVVEVCPSDVRIILSA